MVQMVYDDGFLRVFQTSKGPQVYLGNTRIHHWIPGVILGSLGLLGLLLDDDKRNRPQYIGLSLIGALLILDDLPDVFSFLQGNG